MSQQVGGNRKCYQQSTNLGSKIDRNSVFDCHLSPVGRQMAILENQKVLRCSPDLFNNVKIGQGFTAYNKTNFVLPYMGVAAILVK